ncbi:MAG: prepilin peptidase [Planctomycetes bacterium]|nr:prepilin peptidase [Planctomycetota bacterium]
MEILTSIGASFANHWPIWLVTVFLVVAAVIDGVQLRVPNWLTFPMIISGWAYSATTSAWIGEAWWVGLGWSLSGMCVGLLLLLPAYAIGGMGAGDVKLLAGVGAWVHATHTFYAFCAAALVGGAMAVAMVLVRRSWRKHSSNFRMIVTEMVMVRNASELSAIAAERKSSMLLLPYGIPIAIGSIAYFAWMGMLL